MNSEGPFCALEFQAEGVGWNKMGKATYERISGFTKLGLELGIGTVRFVLWGS